MFPEDTGLIFYPIWMARYKYQERMYFATVDGITGKVLSGRAPGDYMWRSLVMTGGMAVGGFGSCFGLWIGCNVSSSSNGLDRWADHCGDLPGRRLCELEVLPLWRRSDHGRLKDR